MYFEFLSEITEIQTIAAGPSIREVSKPRKQFGHGRWRKVKGIATVKLPSGMIRTLNYTGMRRTESASER